ncbi:MAG: cytochrome c3 family protein [Deltaproteobacteria bacterium]|nr:cytochrome c3 family protein [Deltaproteobacteria bacterium]MBW2500496.1 cytochrome c3 family protein [Deltaproteobacteria bacterium]
MTSLTRGRSPQLSPFAWTILLCALSTLCTVLPSTRASSQQPYSGEGAAACLECHESATVMGIRDTPHADFDDPRSPAARQQCESCHGPSKIHMEFPMQVGNIVFTKHGKTPIAERNQICLECHNQDQQAHWNEGSHGKEIACASCHVMHQPTDPSLVKAGQAQRCGECHADILEKAPDPAPHRLTGPNAMACTECHNPHGPTTLASCNGCHRQDAAALARQTPKARGYHERAVSQKIDCIACHKGFVHAMPQVSFDESPSGNTPSGE